MPQKTAFELSDYRNGIVCTLTGRRVAPFQRDLILNVGKGNASGYIWWDPKKTK